MKLCLPHLPEDGWYPSVPDTGQAATQLLKARPCDASVPLTAAAVCCCSRRRCQTRGRWLSRAAARSRRTVTERSGQARGKPRYAEPGLHSPSSAGRDAGPDRIQRGGGSQGAGAGSAGAECEGAAGPTAKTAVARWT